MLSTTVPRNLHKIEALHGCNRSVHESSSPRAKSDEATRGLNLRHARQSNEGRPDFRKMHALSPAHRYLGKAEIPCVMGIIWMRRNSEDPNVHAYIDPVSQWHARFNLAILSTQILNNLAEGGETVLSHGV